MRLLLDTHAFLWAASRPERLGKHERLVADPATTRLLSAASSWDPFDRLLVAQAQQLGVAILSADPALDAYDVEVLAP